MKVIIPAAGRGTRLLPHTLTKPKQLINVAGKAVLGHIIDKLLELPVEEYIFIVGYLHEQIREYVRQYAEDNLSVPVTFVEQENPLGQADAILRCRHLVEGPVLIVFSDTLTEVDFTGLLGETADVAVYLKEVEDPRRFGIAVTDGNGFVTNFVEKPNSMENRLAVIGMYYIKDSRLLMQCCEDLMRRGIQTKGEYYLVDAFNLMLKEHGVKFRAHPVEIWQDCGKPETLLETNQYLLDHGHDSSGEHPPGNCLVIPPVNIAPTAHIDKAIIGPYATIADHCRIIGSIIRDSIIDEGACIEDTMLESSLIGKDAKVKGRFQSLNVGDSSQVDFA
ncbi:MAG: NTP transferase domain-containing protein [Anaerolineae bacterium]|nr:NTP transferase domain-containing protein [Anaerolineae bacterium]